MILRASHSSQQCPDRTDARGVLEGINNVELPSKVKLHGGQDYMFDNAGEVWASGKSPVNSILKRATQLKKQTGEDPFLLPWRMAPSGSDFAHMTGESHAIVCVCWQG